MITVPKPTEIIETLLILVQKDFSNDLLDLGEPVMNLCDICQLEGFCNKCPFSSDINAITPQLYSVIKHLNSRDQSNVE